MDGITKLLNNQTTLNNAMPAAVNNGKLYVPNVSLKPPVAAAPPASTAGSAESTNPTYRDNYTTSQLPASSVGTNTAVDTTAAAPAAPVMSQADYLAGDSTYQGALAALKKTMAGYQSDYDQNLQKYDTDYNTGLKNLGWESNGTWNQDDQNTAYGKSYNNQLNDFGARDMLQSSFYGDQLNNLLRQFNDQKSSIDTARGNYRDDQASTLSAEKNQTQTAQQQALAESIARMAAGVALPSASS